MFLSLFMATGNSIVDIPLELVDGTGDILTLFKALGVLAILYFIWLIIQGFFTLKFYKKIDQIYSDLMKIKKKLKIK